MKKFLLPLAAATIAIGASADSYVTGARILKSDLENMNGEYKVMLKAYTRNVAGFLHPLEAGDNIHFASKDPNMSETSTFEEEYVYTINVDADGNFTIKNSVGGYAPIPTTTATTQFFYSNTTDESGAVKFRALNCITANSFTDYYMLQATSTGTTGAGHLELHLDGTNNTSSYYSTVDAGMADAGNTTRTAAAIMMYRAISTSFPQEGVEYRIKSRLSDDRANSYIGYNPSTPWYIYNKDTGSRTEKSTSDFINCGNLASLNVAATEDEINSQIWTFIAGTGENEGKYCMVNKAHPDGAVSKIAVDNNGTATTSANNTSRWIYVANRTEDADNVCWFDLSEKETAAGTDYHHFRFTNDNTPSNSLMGLAAGGQKYQIMRWNVSEGSTWWEPLIYIEETFDPQATFDAGVAELKEIAEGCAAMKNLIDNEECPTFTLPEDVTPLTIQDEIDQANTAYAAYIAKFNGKLVNLENKRRKSFSNQTTWLSVYINAQGATVMNTQATPDDNSVWQLIVDSNKLRLYNLTSGRQLNNALLIPAAVSDGVRLQANGTTKYLNMNTTGGNIEWYGVADDPGSVWYVTPAPAYTFCKPEISTADAPRYYRILSDLWMTAKASPNLAINGENREATGEGETVSRAQLGHSGAYWRIEAGSASGSVRIFNLVDGYALGRAAADNNVLTMRDEAAENFYLIDLENTATADASSFNIANTYAICSEATISGSNCLKATANGNSSVAAGTPLVENTGNLANNESAWYFIPVSEAEVAAAEAAYITAMKARISQSFTDDSASMEALAGEEGAKLYTDLFDLTTIESINAAKRNSQSITEDIRNASMMILDNFIVEKQHVQLVNNSRYLIDNGTRLATAANGADANSLWTISKGENGYTLTNESTRNVVTLPNGSNFPTAADNAHEFVMTYYPATAGFSFTKQGAELTDNSASIHRNGSNAIVVWNANNTSSQWHINALEDADIEIIREMEGEQIYLFVVKEGWSICNNGIENDLCITITPLAESRTITEPIEISASSFSDGCASVELEPGKYNIAIPGGMLKNAEGKHTRAYESVYTIDNSGSITSIVDINTGAYTDSNATKVYYDLQGRRVANPRNGIFICNGRKVRL